MYNEALRAPSLRLLLSELRALVTLGRALDDELDITKLPRGTGEPILVLPGYGMGDAHTQPLRDALNALGFAAYGWEYGRNRGMRPVLRDHLRNSLQRLQREHGQPVTLVGWSLGGVFARELARVHPTLVWRVFTLGSPFNGNPDANHLMPLFRLLNGKQRPGDLEGFRRRITAPPVPCTAIYTRNDGIVAWPCCLEDEAQNTENVEVGGRHLDLPFSREVLRVIVERLVQDRLRENQPAA